MPASANDSSGYGVAQIHFRESISPSEVIQTLIGVDGVYSELAFCDATLAELHNSPVIGPTAIGNYMKYQGELRSVWSASNLVLPQSRPPPDE